MPHQWFPTDTVTTIAGFLDSKHYIRLLSTCKLTRDKLTPGRAAAVFPLALKHIHHLILTERFKTEDPVFKLEKSTGTKSNEDGLCVNHLLHYSRQLSSSQEEKLNTYFFLSTETSSIKINVNRWHDYYNIPETSTPGTFSFISIEPSKDHPFKSGTISLREISSDDDEADDDDDTETSNTIWEYTGDLRFFIREIVHSMCPLGRGFYDIDNNYFQEV